LAKYARTGRKRRRSEFQEGRGGEEKFQRLEGEGKGKGKRRRIRERFKKGFFAITLLRVCGVRWEEGGVRLNGKGGKGELKIRACKELCFHTGKGGGAGEAASSEGQIDKGRPKEKNR